MATNIKASEEPQPFNYVNEDTLAKLRNVGSRVRKSVTEGFQRTVSVPADPFSVNKRLPFTQTPSFISANDAMRDMLAQRTAANTNKKGSSSAPSSPQQRPKRVHDGPEDDDEILEDADVELIDDLDLDEDEGAEVTVSAIRAKREAAAKLKEEKAKRAIKPLRRSASRGVATQSLPASMFRFSHEPAGAQAAPGVAKITEEDDWSESLGASGGVPSVNLEL